MATDGLERERYDRLERAGLSMDALPPEQRRVIVDLSDEEVDTLVRVRNRLRAGEQAKLESSSGILYY